MTTEIKISSLASLLLTVKTLKRQNTKPAFSAAEKAERVSQLIDRLAAYRDRPLAEVGQPITRSAEDR